METPQFLVGSYDYDIYIDKKYVGSIKNIPKDRDIFGYQGRMKGELSEDIILRGKTYKKGTSVVTELIPICGKLITK